MQYKVSALAMFSKLACLVNQQEDVEAELAIIDCLRDAIDPGFRNLHVWDKNKIAIATP